MSKDFNSDCFGSEPYRKVRQVLEIKAAIKQAYKEAKRLEALGNSEKAFAEFDKALNGCYELEKAIHAVMKEDVYIVAHAYIAKKNAEKRADKRENRIYNWISLLFAALVAVGTVLAWLYPRERNADTVPPQKGIEAPH